MFSSSKVVNRILAWKWCIFQAATLKELRVKLLRKTQLYSRFGLFSLNLICKRSSMWAFQVKTPIFLHIHHDFILIIWSVIGNRWGLDRFFLLYTLSWWSEIENVLFSMLTGNHRDFVPLFYVIRLWRFLISLRVLCNLSGLW